MRKELRVKVHLKWIATLLVIPYMLLLSGCWDKIEIDERAFILAIAVDTMGGNTGTGSSQQDSGGGGRSEDTHGDLSETSSELSGESLQNQTDKSGYLQTMFFMPVPSKLMSGGVDSFTYELSQGKDVPSAIQALSMGFSRKMFFGQTKLILISRKFSENERLMREFVDYLGRDPEMGRESIVTILDGDISSLQKVKPKFEKVFASYMLGIFDNVSSLTSSMKLPINEFLAEIRGDGGNGVVPVVRAVGTEMRVAGYALLKKFKLDRMVNLKYMYPMGIITDSIKDGDVLAPFREKTLSFKIRVSDTKISADEKEGQLNFKISTEMEGDINNYFYESQLFKADDMSLARAAIQKTVTDELKSTVSFFQETVGTDYLLLRDRTKKHNYKIYQKFKDRWDEEFQRANFTYDIKIRIRRLGGVKE